jgi:hypothetical protein
VRLLPFGLSLSSLFPSFPLSLFLSLSLVYVAYKVVGGRQWSKGKGCGLRLLLLAGVFRGVVIVMRFRELGAS